MTTNDNRIIMEMQDQIKRLIQERDLLKYRCAVLEEQLSIARTSVWISENPTYEKEPTRRRA